MTYRNFSNRQKATLTWWNNPEYASKDGIICDGSIRSGKTVSMALGFVLWSMTTFNGQSFAICGRTIEALRRNVTVHIPTWLEGLFKVIERRSENKIIISAQGRTNVYYLFGGKDERSYTLIQGITVAGVLFDEVALMPRSFVEQAIARCSVSGSKFWFNCNPESPEHWFYKEWIRRQREKNVLYMHFTMNDNLSLSPSIKQRYEGIYSGVFYERYIKGLWVVAEGLIYSFGMQNIVDKHPKTTGAYYISCDYGTRNPFAAGLWHFDGKQAVLIDEYYYSGRDEQSNKTDEEYYAELEKLAGGREIKQVIVDPSAASFTETVRRHRRFTVRKAVNDVLFGISLVSGYLKDGTIKVHSGCKNTIREFGLYRWDDKSPEDKPIKENDHCMDALRYFASTVIKNSAGKERYVPLYERRDTYTDISGFSGGGK